MALLIISAYRPLTKPPVIVYTTAKSSARLPGALLVSQRTGFSAATLNRQGTQLSVYSVEALSPVATIARFNPSVVGGHFKGSRLVVFGSVGSVTGSVKVSPYSASLPSNEARALCLDQAVFTSTLLTLNTQAAKTIKYSSCVS